MATSAPQRLIVLTLAVLFMIPIDALRMKKARSDLKFRHGLTDAESNTMNEMELTDLRSETPGRRRTVVKLAKPKLGGKLNITRPSTGGKVFSGTPKEFPFGQRFREYFVLNGRGTYTTSSNNCINPLFTRKGDGRMCAIGLFSQPKLQCTYITDARLIPDYSKFDKFRAATTRGLGLEFEFVARKQAHNLGGINNCFTNIMKQVTPRYLSKWNWEEDNSVTPLTSQEASSIGAPSSETEGVPFEVTSPGPPNVVSGMTGFRATIDVLTGLKHMGIQAGPSQGFHVHANLWGSAGGKNLWRRQAFYVWAAWAKFQFAIDEMFSPSRPGSHFAQRLFLGNCPPIQKGYKCIQDPCGCNRRFFGNMHKWLKDHPSQKKYDTPRSKNTTKFCNTILTTPGSEKACEFRHPHQRYFQVNLVPMNKFGTVEFRAHSASYNRGRILRYIQFIVAFVERFGLGGGKATGMAQFFTSGSAAADYRKLQRSQQSAKSSRSDELFKQLEGLIASDSKEYYQKRKWETAATDKGCNLGAASTWRADPAIGGPACGKIKVGVSSVSDSLLQQESQEDAWHTPKLISQNNRTRVMQVSVPSTRRPGSYLMVQMPEGNVRAERLHEKSVHDGSHQFSYELTDEAVAEQSI